MGCESPTKRIAIIKGDGFTPINIDDFESVTVHGLDSTTQVKLFSTMPAHERSRIGMGTIFAEPDYDSESRRHAQIHVSDQWHGTPGKRAERRRRHKDILKESPR